VVRAMPNTPALIGKGMTALFARPGVTSADKDWISQVIATTGELIWLTAEEQLDAVTALSGSGPAYMFYFMEAMTEAGAAMGLPREQAYQLAVATFTGAGALAHASSESPEVLRQRVTSKGGTTYAAITSMEQDDIKAQFVRAMQAACQRAKELGDEFGAA
jgi:pyrroline-5-carboxylate reductase